MSQPFMQKTKRLFAKALNVTGVVKRTFLIRFFKFSFTDPGYLSLFDSEGNPRSNGLRAFSFIKWLLKHPAELLRIKGVYFMYLEIPLTTNCTLRCKNCANLMPYYEPRAFIPKEQLLSDIDALLSCVDGIQTFGVLGGEPFLYPYLNDVLTKLIQSDKVTTVRLITNGTIVPKPETVALLKDKKLSVHVSNYHEYSYQIDEWRRLKDQGLSVVIMEADDYWCDYGSVTDSHRGSLSLRRQMNKCNTVCYSYYDGALYRCPRAGHGHDLGLIPLRPDEIVRIRGYQSKEEVREGLINLQKLDYSNACRFCNKGTKRFVEVKAAEQVKRSEDIHVG